MSNLTTVDNPQTWIHYYTARVRACLDDTTVSDHDFRLWMAELIEDLQDFADHVYPVPDAVRDDATALAQAMQQFIFHDGPEPD